MSVDLSSFVWLLGLEQVKNALRNGVVFDSAGRPNGLELVTEAVLCISLLSALPSWLVRVGSSRLKKAQAQASNEEGDEWTVQEVG